MRRPRFHLAGLAGLGLLVLSTGGCDWLAKPAGDPRREGNYQDGLRWVDQQRWENARESFYHALEANPQNLQAHLQLGDLYAKELKDPVLTIYHYTRYLELGRLQNHGTFQDQSAADGIRNAHVELARTFAERMFRDQQQYELDGLRRTNAVLLERIDVLNRQVAMLTQHVVAATNLQTQAQPPGPVPNPPTGTRAPVPGGTVVNPPATNRAAPAGASATQPAKRPEPAATNRTHRVQNGDTLATIARRYGVRLASLQAANPGVRANNLKAGQVLVVPPR